MESKNAPTHYRRNAVGQYQSTILNQEAFTGSRVDAELHCARVQANLEEKVRKARKELDRFLRKSAF